MSHDKMYALNATGVFDVMAQELDIPDEMYDMAKSRYTDLSKYLRIDHIKHFRSDASIYPQGSISLGTTIKPVNPDDEYDIDLVYCRQISKDSISQTDLKKDLQYQLKRYLDSIRRIGKPPPTLKEGSRCWTLEYKGQFHMDILPAIPDPDSSSNNSISPEDGIIITDKNQSIWKPTNPKGYCEWFEDQQTVSLLEERLVMAKTADVDVEMIPTERVPTPLRRAIQILKRHRDMKYKGNPDDKPISVIITTLAAKAYRGEQDVFSSLTSIIPRMKLAVEKHNGEYWIGNPVNPNGENFADKWGSNREPQRAQRFFEWLEQVNEDLSSAKQQRGLHKFAERLSPVFGASLVESSMEKLGKLVDQKQQSGNLFMATGTGQLGASGTKIKRNTWYGK